MATQSLNAPVSMNTPYTPDLRGSITIAINQVEYTPEGPVVHIFGRDDKGTAHTIRVTGFRPYFYVPAFQVVEKNLPQEITVDITKDYSSIKGEKLRRLYTRRPSDVRNFREQFQHYEADILFTTRFLIDCGLTGGG